MHICILKLHHFYHGFYLLLSSISSLLRLSNKIKIKKTIAHTQGSFSCIRNIYFPYTVSKVCQRYVLDICPTLYVSAGHRQEAKQNKNIINQKFISYMFILWSKIMFHPSPLFHPTFTDKNLFSNKQCDMSCMHASLNFDVFFFFHYKMVWP